MTSVLKNLYTDWLDDIKIKHNQNKLVDVKSRTCIDFNVKNNDKDTTFEVGDFVWISRYNIFGKDYTPSLSQKVFVFKKVKNTVPWTYTIEDLNGEEISGTFYEKEFQKTS